MFVTDFQMLCRRDALLAAIRRPPSAELCTYLGNINLMEVREELEAWTEGALPPCVLAYEEALGMWESELDRTALNKLKIFKKRKFLRDLALDLIEIMDADERPEMDEVMEILDSLEELQVDVRAVYEELTNKSSGWSAEVVTFYEVAVGILC
tara:strand:- start:5820 stop:6278 length:459 start_codon:yes stop_codon:yes gene_type:complete